MNDLMKMAKLAGARIKVHGLNATPYAIVKDGVVINVTLWDSAEHPDWRPNEGEAIPCDASVSIGHLWDGTKFINPNPPVKKITPLPAYKAKRVAEIDRAFRSASVGLFVDDVKREAMRAAAMGAVDAVNAADTHDAVNAAAGEILAALR